MTRTTCWVLILFAVTVAPAFAESDSVQLRGTIRNGTTGRAQKVDQLQLLRLEGGMKTLQVIADAGPDFRFDPAPRDAPLLIRATYGGTFYTQMVPPAPEKQNREHTLTVFDPGALRSDVNITPLYQLVNTKDGLRVSKLYAIENESKPPRSYTGDPLIYVPPGALELSVQLRNPDSSLPVPLSLVKEGEFLRADRGFRPGRSLLTVDFSLSAREWSDRTPPGETTTAIVFWRPEAAQPEIAGGKKKLLEIPDEGPAFQVRYPPDGAVRFRVNSDAYYFENPMAAHENAFLNSTGRTILALVVTLSFFFLLISILSALRRGGGSFPE